MTRRRGGPISGTVSLGERPRHRWPVIRAANALDDVRSKVLDRPPSKTVRPLGRDVFRRLVQTVRHRTVLGFRPIVAPDIVGSAAQQQIESLAVPRVDGPLSRPGRNAAPPIRRGDSRRLRSARRGPGSRRPARFVRDLSHGVSFPPLWR